MLAFKSERVSKGDPGWAKAWIHERCLAAHGGGILVCNIMSKKKPTDLKYCRACGHFWPPRYHTPTAYQLIGFSGSRSTISWARMKSFEWRCDKWYMHAICNGIVWLWIWTRPRILIPSLSNTAHLSKRNPQT